MAMACEICGKKPSFGNTISHAHNVTRRRWNPNLRRVRAVIQGAAQTGARLHPPAFARAASRRLPEILLAGWSPL